MNSRPKHNAIEIGFVLAMVVLCAALSLLQWRWTGELARAETARLQGSLDEPARRLAQAFDAELAAACAQLTPSRAELDERGVEAAHLLRLREWLAGKPRPIFSRIATGTASGGDVRLALLDQKELRAVPVEWPAEWAALHDNLARKLAGGSPPLSDARGLLIEFPIFRGRGGPAGESWLILELDAAHARESWLPALVREHLNLDDLPLYDVTVRAGATGIYASRADTSDNRATPLTVKFNRMGRGADDDRRGPPDDFRGPPDGGPGGPPGRAAAWTLEARRRPGALEAVVAASRWRNVTVAVGLNALMLAAGLALVRHTRRSRALAEAQMNFVATVSHELRTPLTVIRGAAHNLARGVVSEPERVGQYAGLITQHAEQLQEMVEQVLTYAGTKKNSLAALRTPVVLGEVLGEAIAAAAPETQAAHCKMEIQIADALPSVNGDAAALRRALQNLIANAAKHGGTGGWIGITAAATNGSAPPMIEVQIADRGPGIPEAEQAEIFEPFVRGARAQSAQVRGSGLGLSLVREIIEAHGGTVGVCSDHGATFTVRLPADLGSGHAR